MAVWLKVAILIAGVLGFGGVVYRFGLPSAPPQQQASPAPAPAAPAPVTASPAAPSPAPATPPAAPATPAAPSAAPAQSAAVQPSAPPAASPPPAAPSTPTAPATPPPAASQPEPLPPPTFDVVRVEPTGEAVVAGRTLPGARITLLRNGAVHDSAVADAAGQFALVPPRLPPGNHELTLAVTGKDGRTEASRQTVTVAIPTSAGGEVIVALASPDAPTRLLSAPKAVATAPAAATPAPASPPAGSTAPSTAPAPAASAPAGGPRTRVVVTTVEADEGGRFFATGQAAPGATVRLYLNDTFLAAATAGPDGRWSFTIGKGLEPGAYRVRLDDVDPANGAVQSRAEVPFQFAPRVAAASTTGPATAAAPATAPGAAPAIRPSSPPQAPAALPAGSGSQVAAATPSTAAPAAPGADVVVPEVRSTLVTRGDSLWRISRRVYGRGVRYTVIYEANQQQIRDPARIYPGQIFVVPGEAPN